jgi:elongation factor 1-gamma
MVGYTLHTPAGSFRAFKILIAAEYNGVSIDVPTFDASAAASLSPTGKAPVLQTSTGQVIFESNAIARYIAKLRRDTGLTGDGSIVEEASVDSWVDFSANNIELPASVWWYPAAGYMPFQKEAYEKAKADLAKALEVLNNHLLYKTYLINDQITLADITVASALIYPFKLVCTKDYLKPFGNVLRWFQTCVNQPEFKAVVGEVTMCKKELQAKGQESAAPAKADKKKDEGKKEKKVEAAEPAPAAPAKKPDHPYKIMDKDAPSAFIMDAWKKTYSNTPNLDDAMKIFWETVDLDGWSIWHQAYNYNSDNKRAFMTSNAVTGFQQRTDEIRKWAFGIMDVLGSEETVLEICGMWLLRGDTVEHMINANDDANWYTWKKLAGKDMAPTDEVKKLVRDYWVCENELEGKPIVDSKVFK